MIWLLVTLVVILICFAGVLLIGAPYLPTLTPQVKVALTLVDLQPGDTLLELGCGDGKVLIVAAQQGLRVVGYEVNPLLALTAWLRTRHYRHQVRIIWGDFWKQEWPPAQAIFVFLLPKYMTKLDTKITHQPDLPIKLVSFAFQIPGKQARAEKAGVYLYHYD